MVAVEAQSLYFFFSFLFWKETETFLDKDRWKQNKRGQDVLKSGGKKQKSYYTKEISKLLTLANFDFQNRTKNVAKFWGNNWNLDFKWMVILENVWQE